MNERTKQRLVFWPIVVVVSVLIYVTVSSSQKYRLEQARVDGEVLSKLVNGLGQRFSDVHVMVSTHPRANVMGTVAKQDDQDVLRTEMSRVLGTEGMDRVNFNVHVTPSQEH